MLCICVNSIFWIYHEEWYGEPLAGVGGDAFISNLSLKEFIIVFMISKYLFLYFNSK